MFSSSHRPLASLCVCVVGAGARHLLRCSRQGLVARAAVVCRAVGEKPVDKKTADGEEEDEERPEKLVDGRAVRLDDLDWMAAWLAK